MRLDSSQPKYTGMRGEIYLAKRKKDLAKRDFREGCIIRAPTTDLNLQQTGK